MSHLILSLLSTIMVFWSDREGFFNPEKASTRTVEWTSEGPKEIDFTQLQNGRVLLLVHGYNNTENNALERYLKILQFIADSSEGETYTHVIGYLWPGYDDAIEYSDAKESVKLLTSRMKSNLKRLSASVQTLDVIAHSMGNRLILESLLDPSLSENRPLIRYFYSFAPAVDDESIEKKQIYYPSTQRCQEMFVFHSDRDSVLRFGYLIAEKDVALGADRSIEFANMPNNVQFINCSALIDNHSAYFSDNALPLYRFICNEKTRTSYLREYAGKDLVFTRDGSIAQH